MMIGNHTNLFFCIFSILYFLNRVSLPEMPTRNFRYWVLYWKAGEAENHILGKIEA